METIAAVATARGAAGMGIVRISGDNAIRVANACFSSKRDINKLETYSAVYGKVMDGENTKVTAKLVEHQTNH